MEENYETMTGGINNKVDLRSTSTKEVDLRSTSTKVADNNTRSIRCACLSLVVAILAAVVILNTAGAFVNFAVEIEQLKSETADCHKSYDSAIQELNATLYANRNLDPNLSDFLIWQLSQNITLLNSSIQELKLETADYRKSYDSAIQELNASLYADRNLDPNLIITLLNSSIQELKRDLMTLTQISPLPSSCATLPSSSPSGYYLISPSNGSGPVSVYCDMDRTCGGVTGGWMRVAKLDMTDSSQSCTNGLVQRNFNSNLRLCARPEVVSGCTSLNFTANNVPYSKVCGRVRGYQYGVLDAFRVYFDNFRRLTLEDFYVYGAVLTHGHPRQHIWTFVAARDELVTHNWSGCLCLRPNFPEPPPPFIGNDYFCDTGSREHFRGDTFYGDDPLWDGAGCESIRGFDNTCCTFNTPPWFYRQLPQLTTDDVEMRVCRATENISDLGIESFEIYVQ